MALIFHPPNTWNNAETTFTFEAKPIGTFDGVSDSITFTADHGTIVSSWGTATPSYTHPTLTATAGTLRNILFSDGTLVPLDEGEGTTIHDSNGNVVGTLSSADVTGFWSGEPMVSPEVMAMEADQGSTVYTDGLGHAFPFTQADIEDSLIINNNNQYYFTNCTGKPKQLINYKTERTIAEDFEIKTYGCL